MQIAKTLQHWRAGFTSWRNRMGGALVALGMVAMLAAAPSAQAQIKNGGFETGTFSDWTLRDYRRNQGALDGDYGPNLPTTPNNLDFVAPTQFSQLKLTYNNNQVVSGAANQNATYRSQILTTAGTAPNTNNIVQYPFSGNASARLGGGTSDGGIDTGYGATRLEQTATMSLADVDPIDGKVHIRFAMAPVLVDAGHNSWHQPFFFVEVRNLTKGDTQIFNTFNFSTQSGIPWTKVGAYRSTNWQGFDIAPGNGQLDPGDQVLLRVVVANCSDGGASHTAAIYMDVFGSKMPGLSVAATGPSTTLPGAQITYDYNYTNNSGVYALDAWVRLAAPVTVDGKPLIFTTYPGTCTGIHAGISPRADYIDCPVGDLVAGAGGSFPVTFTVPNDAATTGPNNVINNGDYDIRASTVSPFIGPLVKTTIAGGTTLVDLGITISNGGVPSYLVGGLVQYTVTVTNHSSVDVVDAVIKQDTLTGVTNAGAATWTCSSAGSAVCGGTSGVTNGAGMLNTIGSLPAGESLTYTITTLNAQAAGTPVVTTVSVAPPAGMTDSVAANNTAGLSTPVSAAQYRLTVNTIGTGLGGVNAVPAASACPIAAVPAAVCSDQQLGQNEDAYLTAVVGTKTIFKGWTGGCTTVTGNECHVNMGVADKDVTAEFAAAWLVTPTVIGGTWTGDPLVEDGLTGSITITPGPGIAGAPVVTSDNCTGVLTGPVAGKYTFTTAVMHADCAFTVEFPSPKLDITKSGPVSATVGTGYSYTILVENTGAVATTAATTVSDMVPTGLTINSAPGCTVVSPLVTCTVATGLAVGGSQSFTINVTPTANGTVNNTASASGGGDTACPAANPCRSNTVSTTIANLPALSIVKTASVASTVVGVAYDYTLTVSNSGATTTAPATVIDDVPAGLVINSATGGAGCVIAGQQVTCTVATGLTSATPTVFTINVTPMAAAGASVSNTASVSGGGDPTCPALTPCDSTPVVVTLVPQNAVLDLEKTAGPPTGDRAGDTISYSFKLTNSGNVALSGVALDDPLLGGAVACPATTLAAGASMVCGPVVYTMTQADVDGAQVQNTATATGLPPVSIVGVPPVPVTGTDSTNTPIAHNLDQLLVKAVTADSTGGDAAVGDVLTYTVTLTNKSNATLFGVEVSDAMITPSSITCGSVAPDAVCELVGTYTVTQADADAGMVRNTAVASGPMCPAGTTDPRCTTTITTPVVSLIANDDETTTKAATPVTTPVTGNDTHTGGAIDPGSVTVTTPSPKGTLSVDPATGAITFTPTPGFTGTTSYVYRVCLAAPNGTVCDTATVTVTVVPLEIRAEDDVLPPVEGGTGTTVVGNVFDNDTLEGDPIDPTTITTTVTKPATPINGGQVPTLNPGTGVVSVPPGTPAGEYTIEYRICEVLYPDNCDTATVTVTVTAPLIEAVEDTSDPLTGDGGGNTPSVLDNDRLGGKPIQPGQVTLIPGTPSHPDLKMNPDGTIRIGMRIPTGTYTFPYTICEVLNPTNCSSTTATVIVTGQVQLRVVKTVGVREVHLGDLVRYTLTVENTGNAALVGGDVVDAPAAGLSYVEGSLLVEDGDNAGTVSGQRPLRFGGLDIPAGGQARLVYLMRVGAGARAGVLANQAQAVTPDGDTISNVATAEVILQADALLDDSLVFGTVFNDRDGDGWQDSAALSGVKVQGGFAPDAYVAGSTTVDRGDGMRAEADASAPLLHGIALGAIAGRQSEADPVERHQMVIRQQLRELAFTDDFVLTNDQGVTVRMDRSGATTVEKSGEAAKGLNAAAPTVERRIAQGGNGYVVDYVVRNAGLDERGIPGVRIASVEGLLIETDQFGRYHLAGMSGGAWERGRNFVLKVDPFTLPAGATFSTDNPLLRRLTPGVPVRFDWGVKLPVQEIGGGRQQVELEMGEVFFAPGSAEVQSRYQPVVEAMAAKVREHPGAEVVIQADAAGEALAFQRAEAVKAALLAQLDAAAAKGVVVSTRAKVDDAGSLVAGVTGDGVLLGTVLFDTDKSAIRPEFKELLDKVADALKQMRGGSVSIVGHTDVRGSNAYNTALGMRRAKAVFDALAERLDAETRSRLRVDIANDPAAPVGVRK